MERFSQNNPWTDFIVAGASGGISDKIQMQRPYISDSMATNTTDSATIAITFYKYLQAVISYICNGTAEPTSTDKTIMTWTETSVYVSFKYKAIEWRIYKQGYSTVGYPTTKAFSIAAD